MFNTYHNAFVQMGVAVLIFFNFISSAVKSQILPEKGSGAEGVFWHIETVFTFVFIFELLWNMYGSFFCRFWKSGWNIFDFIIVLISTVALIFEDLPAFNVLRLFRAFRVFRLFKRIKSLRCIIEGVFASVPGVANAFMVLTIIMGIWSILGVEFFRDIADEEFGDFGKAMFTMFQVMTMDSWASAVARQLIFAEGKAIVATSFFVVYIFIAGIVMTNVVVAILLEKYLGATANHNKRVRAEKRGLSRRAIQSTKVKEKSASPLRTQLKSASPLRTQRKSAVARGKSATTVKEGGKTLSTSQKRWAKGIAFASGVAKHSSKIKAAVQQAINAEIEANKMQMETELGEIKEQMRQMRHRHTTPAIHVRRRSTERLGASGRNRFLSRKITVKPTDIVQPVRRLFSHAKEPGPRSCRSAKVAPLIVGSKLDSGDDAVSRFQSPEQEEEVFSLSHKSTMKFLHSSLMEGRVRFETLVAMAVKAAAEPDVNPGAIPEDLSAYIRRQAALMGEVAEEMQIEDEDEADTGAGTLLELLHGNRRAG